MLYEKVQTKSNLTIPTSMTLNPPKNVLTILHIKEDGRQVKAHLLEVCLDLHIYYRQIEPTSIQYVICLHGDMSRITRQKHPNGRCPPKVAMPISC